MSKPRAVVLVRSEPSYRRDAVVEGLAACGYEVVEGAARLGPADVVVCWNRHVASSERMARACEVAGGRVVVMENGYVGADGGASAAGEPVGHQLYALALGGHNGSGRWRVGEADRWVGLGVEVRPWRSAAACADGHVVVVAQRGIGSQAMRSPMGWAEATAERVRTLTRRRVVVQRHCGKPACSAEGTRVMRAALAGAWACVVWGSANGVRALVEGVPVVRMAPWWVAEGAAGRALTEVEEPPMPEREPVLHRLSWAQWTVSELASGEAFRWLLGSEGRMVGAGVDEAEQERAA